MQKIIVNVMPEETRIAIVEGDRLAGLELERPGGDQLVGNIYKGVVQNVLPGMQAAFVDIGREKNAFLYIGDGKQHDGRPGAPAKPIHVGQVLPVQITKEEVGAKGARATLHLAVPGRNVVLMPRSAYIGTSRRIASPEERKRLYDIVRAACPEDMGVIIRTAAEGQPEESIQRDVRYLVKLWRSVESRAKKIKNTGLLYQEEDLVVRMVRDLLTDDVEKLVIDDEAVYQRAGELLQDMAPEWADRLELYTGPNIFASYGLEADCQQAAERQVPLKSGGFLVIDKTEAMTVIDVNTGSFVGNVNMADTAFALNQEAAIEIMRQLRLRDIGGIILIDFIDMEREQHKEALLQLLQRLARQDRTKTHVVDITPLGLVEITRKKSRHSLEALTQEECPACHGMGKIISTEALAIKICRDIRRIEAGRHSTDGYTLRLRPEALLTISTGIYFQQLKKELGVRIRLEADKELLPGSYILLS